MSRRVFVVGTDTGVGKTAVTAALLHTARDRGVRMVPFKPAQSGEDDPSDIERLLDAAGLDRSNVDVACPLRFDPPLAPGLAEDAAPFLDVTSQLPTHERTPPGAVLDALDRWEALTQPSVTLVEGAGGLQVPMPGATWQGSWISALAARTLIVGRAGLGTINHTLLTIDALRHLGRPPLGFILSQTSTATDPSVDDNARVIETASGVAHLGTLPHGPEPASAPALLDALLSRLEL
ncbi:MAG: dethiobiotin synthase [Deltaproteobacteria bacterium]|nr:dethiobiotin synthase [Deltaproteobacteria bacterium]